MARPLQQRERDLRTLRRSELHGCMEFHIMCGDVEHYHKQLKYDFMSGRAKAPADVDVNSGENHMMSFYGTLINMLLEISRYSNRDKQHEDLRQIYAWYQANKHLIGKDGQDTSSERNPRAPSLSPGPSHRCMSSMDNSSRSGVLRYTYANKPTTAEGNRQKRPDTATSRLTRKQISSRSNESLVDQNRVKNLTNASDLAVARGSKTSKASLDVAPRGRARPETAPATLVADFERFVNHLLEGNENQLRDSEVNEEFDRRPVSRISVHFRDEKHPDSQGKAVSSPVPAAKEERESVFPEPCPAPSVASSFISVDKTEAAHKAYAHGSEALVTNSNRESETQGKENHSNDAKGLSYQSDLLSADNESSKLQQRRCCAHGDLDAQLVLEMATPVGKKILQARGHSPPDRLTKIDGSETSPNSVSQLVSEIKVSLGEMAKPYDVHFDHDLRKNAQRRYRTSGRVEPESHRYRWREDGHGGRTFVKKMSRHDMLSREGVARRDSGKSSARPCAVIRTSSHKRILDPKSLASMLVVKHLGFVDRRPGDRFAGYGETKPVYYEDSQDYNLNSEYLSFTKGLELKYGMKGRVGGQGSHSNDHVKLKLPYLHYKDKAKHADKAVNGSVDLESNGDTYEYDSWPADLVKLANGSEDILRKIIEESRGTLPVMNDDEDRRLAAMRGTQSIDSAPSEARGKALRLEPKPHSQSMSMSSSITSKSRPQPSVEDEASESSKRDLSFDVSHFHHFCFDDNPDLDDEYRLQMEVNAAVDIQRIFRGHMVREYMKRLKDAEKERQRKAAVALQSAMRGYLTRKRLMEENIRSREPTVATYEWAKQYKEELKKKDYERKQKLMNKAKQDNKVKVTHEEALKKVTATEQIYDLFHDKTPSKAQMRAAAITIQRYVRGWLVRRFLEKAKTKAMKRTLDFGGFITTYRKHLSEIMKRHGVDNPEVVVKFNELLQYIERRNKYEIEFDRMAQKTRFITYQDIKTFFEACKTCPSIKEINDAVQAVLSPEEFNSRKGHRFTKAEMVDIAFHIFVPKGTQLKDTRQSTWMNPLLGVDEKTKLALSKKVKGQTDFNLAFRLVSSAKAEREEMAKRSINPESLPEDAKREGFINPSASDGRQVLTGKTTKNTAKGSKANGLSPALKKKNLLQR